MITVIFEAWPATEQQDIYLDLARTMRRELAEIEGFVSVERFQSLSETGKLLSLSFFRDEAAVRAWRNLPCHRAAQAEGRGVVFADYRLRVAKVRRDYGRFHREESPADSRRMLE